MARTNVDDLKNIIDTDLSDPILEAYINSANVFVTGVLDDKGLSDAIMEEIEKWVAAHMIASTRERMGKEEEAGGARIEYLGKYGEGLASTPYGQMAIQLDTTGTLSSDLQGKKLAWSKAVTSFEYD
jgi:hypothetical protein